MTIARDRERATEPSRFLPADPGEFIGPARKSLAVLVNKCARLSITGGSMRVLIYGPPGTGKSRIAEVVASHLTAGGTDVERINGRNLNGEVARRWLNELAYIPMFGWRVKLVNEVDLATNVAQDLLLDWLDQVAALPTCNTAIVASTNLKNASLTERFESRFQRVKVDCPSTEEITDLLVERWGITKAHAVRIAVGSGGNVRSALLDTESYLDGRDI